MTNNVAVISLLAHQSARRGSTGVGLPPEAEIPTRQLPNRPGV